MELIIQLGLMEEFLLLGVFAGLVSPSLAGWLFDQYNNYNASLLISFILSIIAGLVIWNMKYEVIDSKR